MAATQTNPTDETVAIDAQHDDLCERDIRALIGPMTVIDDCGDVRGADGLYEVTTASGSEYIVNMHTESCTCGDHEYRHNKCKHIRRVAYETGVRAIPGWVNLDVIDDALGEFVESGEPRVAMTDGGGVSIAEAREARTGGRYTVEEIDGGALVWDVAFPVWGSIFLVVGYVIVRGDDSLSRAPE